LDQEEFALRQAILTALATGLVAGFFIGFMVHRSFAEASSAGEVTRSVSAPTAGPSDQNLLSSGGSNPALAQQILSAEANLRVDPKNVQAWITLGNAYFDMHQAQKSVDAYSKALALDPKNPNAPDLLTDQGVMYRELQSYDMAVDNFKRANKLDPKHAQSLFNLGVVLYSDKHDLAGARKAWNRVIELVPSSTLADQARDLLTKASN